MILGRAGCNLTYWSLEKYRKAIAKDVALNQKFLKAQKHYIKKRNDEPGKSRLRDKSELKNATTVDVTKKVGRQWIQDKEFIEQEVPGATAANASN